MTLATFRELELSGWTEKAHSYDEHFCGVTQQAFQPMLSCLGDLQHRTMLDICCGTGSLAASAIEKGASVTGVDFAPTMVEIAVRKVPAAKFEVGDAEALRFVDNSFDVATCAFGLLHLANPDRAVNEAVRVLKPGGVYCYTTWLSPEQGWDMFDLLLKAIKRHGTPEVALPPAPSPFRFADDREARNVLQRAGFASIVIEKCEAVWVGESGEQLLDLMYKGIVRAPMLIEAQAPEARQAVREDIRLGAEAMRSNGKIRMRWPYLLVTARKPVD